VETRFALLPGHDAGKFVMHDIKWIRDNAAAFDAGLKRRGLAPLSASLLAIDEKRRAAIQKSEQAQARRNAASKEIGDAKKARDDARAAALMTEVSELKTTMPELEAAAKAADDELAAVLAAIPNLPLDEVPDGVDEHGCSAHLVTSELDDGPVLIQARVPVLPGDDAETLAARVLVEEHRIYPEALARLAREILG